ncbi:MAG: hypothetical protein J6B80_05160 [Clostridia bacterium]|nr:hypothetical protein [Clostridia bacterium]
MSSFKIFLKTFVISGWCLVLFVGLGYYYIDSHDIKVENNVESVPYYTQTPDNKGVMFIFGTKSVYTYFDFENSSVTVILNRENIEETGYPVDYTAKVNYNVIAEICDYFEGINLMIDAETLRYTGNQVVELLSASGDYELREKVITAIFKKMSQQGVEADFFNTIINESKTNLKMPDCYFWTDFMDDIAKDVKILTNN